MKEERVKVYGRNSASEQKRAFDIVMLDGKCFIENKDPKGHYIRTPIEEFQTRYHELLRHHISA